jgi:hypothetical protein
MGVDRSREQATSLANLQDAGKGVKPFDGTQPDRTSCSAAVSAGLVAAEA